MVAVPVAGVAAVAPAANNEARDLKSPGVAMAAAAAAVATAAAAATAVEQLQRNPSHPICSAVTSNKHVT